MGRIAHKLQQLATAGRKALIPYVTAGFPDADATLGIMHAMIAAGADAIELGVPFSDPSADGPVIQRANERALALGIGLPQVFGMVREFRAHDTDTPVVLMGYANPVERYDQRHAAGAFVRDAASSGVDGVLVVDYPPAECTELAAALRAAGMDLIFLLAPTSSEARMREIAAIASGYVYYVSLRGVTGSGALDTTEVQAMLARIRQHVKIPLGVGFGIRNAETACAVAHTADAVIIGSALIERVENAPPGHAAAAAAEFLAPIRAALDRMTNVEAGTRTKP